MARGASSWPAVAAASAVASGSSTASPTASNPATDPRTRATYRMLIFRGLAPTEAANLTAYLCGIAVGDAAWSLPEINRLLFLRELNRTGRFGSEDGTPTH
jgi:hypothetical protein